MFGLGSLGDLFDVFGRKAAEAALLTGGLHEECQPVARVFHLWGYNCLLAVQEGPDGCQSGPCGCPLSLNMRQNHCPTVLKRVPRIFPANQPDAQDRASLRQELLKGEGGRVVGLWAIGVMDTYLGI